MSKEVTCPVCQDKVRPVHWGNGGSVCPGSLIIMNRIPQDRQVVVSNMINDYIDSMPKVSMVKIVDLARHIKSELQSIHSLTENFNSIKDFIRILAKERVENKGDIHTEGWSWHRVTSLVKK